MVIQTGARTHLVPTSAARLDNIQYLRGLAAVYVLVFHAGALPPIFSNIGVEVFFIVSGFIMLHTSYDRFGQPGAAWSFLAHRLVRIVPLYYFFTLVRLALRIASHEALPPTWVVASLLFIPYDIGESRFGRGHRLIEPVLGPGWTLQYEMLFYAIFFGSLLFVIRTGVIYQTVCLLTLVMVLPFFPDYTFFAFAREPVVLLFLIGSLSSLLFRRWHRRLMLPVWPLIAGITAAVLAVAISFPQFQSMNMVHMPIAVMIFVIMICSSNRAPINLWTRFAHLIGDASYSLYLSHTIVLIFVRYLVKIARAPYPDVIVPFIAIPASLAVAVFVWRHVEMPLLGGFRRLYLPSAPAPTRPTRPSQSA